jgi:outer membrane receptor protein involved in Fe transport
VSPKISGKVGVHMVLSKITEPEAKSNVSVEPRVAFQWHVSEKQQVTLSYGLHSQMQQPQVYLAEYVTTDVSGNLHLKPAKSHHLVVGYQRNFEKNASIKVEAYWQEQFDIAIGDRFEPNFSALNMIENRILYKLINGGKGRNYGIEATYQKMLTQQYYMLLSGSLYDATFVANDGVQRDSRYNGRHTFSLTAGKEFSVGESSIWGVNAKILWLGGFRDTPIDLATSQKALATVYAKDVDFSYKMKDYFRPDLRIYWKKSNARYSRTIAIDLQNVSGTKNEAFKYYDTLKKDIVTQYQLGLIPVLSYRWEF